MPSTSPEKQSYVRVVHEVKATEDLYKFLRQIAGLGLDILGYRDATLVRQRRISQSVDGPSHEAGLQGIGVDTVDLISSDKLHATVFERRMPRSQRANSALLRLSAKIMQDKDIALLTLPDSEMHSKPEYLIECPARSQGSTREFGIIVAESPFSKLSRAEHDVLADKTRSTASRYDWQTEPSCVPLLRVPAITDGRQVRAFVDEVNDVIEEKAMYGELPSFQFGSLETVTKLR